MFRDATKARQASLSNPLLHPVSSVPTDAAILRLQFDSSPPLSILDSYRTLLSEATAQFVYLLHTE